MNSESFVPEEPVSRTVGECLREAREKMGLADQDIATRLCLKISTVSDIEENRFSPELSATFWRGYVRSYARLVNLPEGPLLSMLDRQSTEWELKVAPSTTKKKRGTRARKRSSDSLLILITCLVVLAILGVSAAWWWQNYLATRQVWVPVIENEKGSSEPSQPESPLQEPRSSISPQENTESLSSELPPSHPKDAAPSPFVLSQEAESQTPPSFSAEGIDATKMPQILRSTEQHQSYSENPLTVSPDGSIASGTLKTPELIEQESPSQDRGPAPPSQHLEIQFTGDCWIEVRDASGEKRFSGFKHNGEALMFSGNAPYQLRIGAPTVAKIKYDGQIVDLRSFIQSGQVANITLGTP